MMELKGKKAADGRGTNKIRLLLRGWGMEWRMDAQR